MSADTRLPPNRRLDPRTGATYRAVLAADVPACIDVFYASIEELHQRLGQPVTPRNPARLALLFEHFVRSDPDQAWLAEVDGFACAFGMASQREDHWYLGFLFVLRDWQSRGVGRALIERCLPPRAQRAQTRLAVCVEAIQPVSTGLYASFGMTPRVPIYLLTGRLDRPALVAEADPAVKAPEAAALPTLPMEEVEARQSEIDRAILGYARPQEHAYVRAGGSRGFLYRSPSSGSLEGYGYVHDSGRLGPVALLRPELLTPVIAHLVANSSADVWQVIVPGPAAHALVPLIRGGLRIDGGPAVYSSSWQGPQLDRYLPINFALL